jgi:hypothetical protein
LAAALPAANAAIAPKPVANSTLRIVNPPSYELLVFPSKRAHFFPFSFLSLSRLATGNLPKREARLLESESD